MLTSSTVSTLVTKFRESGSIHDVHSTGRPKTTRSNENVESVRQNVCEHPGTSIRHRGQELQISRSSPQRILNKDLHLHAYKVQIG